jgi:uncharacterized protein
MPSPFLTARWRWLLMLNYRVDPARIAPFVPAGCEVDLFEGETFVSLVGFLFEDTRLKGVPVPFHQHFEEVNLRYYIRRPHPEGDRRAVGFIREIVPKWAIATVARLVYQENYIAVPMRHTVEAKGDELPVGAEVSYGWELGGRWHAMSARVSGPAAPLPPGSHEAFIAEHYWGYAAQRNGGTVEYQVAHPEWRAFPVVDVAADLDARAVYGEAWAEVLEAAPVSAFVAEGSEVTVYDGEVVVQGGREA